MILKNGGACAIIVMTISSSTLSIFIIVLFLHQTIIIGGVLLLGLGLREPMDGRVVRIGGPDHFCCKEVNRKP